MSNVDGDRLLLDTHMWIWSTENNERMLTRHMSRVIERAAQRGSLLIAAISLWEVALLNAKGRIRLLPDPSSWYDRALGATGLSVVNLTPQICTEAARMPFSDPADRLIAASARASQASLVTRDARLLDYAGEGHLRVIDATR